MSLYVVGVGYRNSIWNGLHYFSLDVLIFNCSISDRNIVLCLFVFKARPSFHFLYTLFSMFGGKGSGPMTGMEMEMEMKIDIDIDIDMQVRLHNYIGTVPFDFYSTSTCYLQ